MDQQTWVSGVYEGVSIRSLSPEIFSMILELIHDTYPVSLSALTLVSKMFYALARVVRQRHQSFDFNEETSYPEAVKSLEYMRSLTNDPKNIWILNSIRTIRIWSSFPPLPTSGLVEDKSERYQPIVNFIKKIARLTAFTFECHQQLPICIISTLSKCHPTVHLHISNWTRINDVMYHNDPTELALATCPNLRSLSAEFHKLPPKFDFRPEAFRRIVATSPHLETVSLFIDHQFRSSFSPLQNVEVPFPEACCQGCARQNMFPPPPSPNNIKTLKAKGMGVIKLLTDATDLSKLEKLELDETPSFLLFNKEGSGQSFFPSLNIDLMENQNYEHKFQSLAKFSIELPCNLTEDLYLHLKNFILNCNPLRTLSITNASDKNPSKVSLKPILARHRQNLSKLILHNIPYESGEYASPFTPAQVQEIGRQCPLLEEIQFEILNSYSGRTEYLIFEKLAMFKNLSVVRLCLHSARHREEGIGHRDRDEAQYSKNPFDRGQVDVAENIWYILSEGRRRHGGVALRELYVKAERWVDSSQDNERVIATEEIGLVEGERWEEWHYVASPSVRDDGEGSIFLVMMTGNGKQKYETRWIPDREALEEIGSKWFDELDEPDDSHGPQNFSEEE